MKLNGNFILKNIAGTFYAVPLGETSKSIKGMIKLNDTAAFIWEQLEKEASENEIVSSVASRFKVSEEEAKNDFLEFANALKEANILV
jgi:hypothetical protein